MGIPRALFWPKLASVKSPVKYYSSKSWEPFLMDREYTPFVFEKLGSLDKGLSKFEVYLPSELPVRSNSKNKPDRRRSYNGISYQSKGGNIFWLSSLFPQWDWFIRVGAIGVRVLCY